VKCLHEFLYFPDENGGDNRFSNGRARVQEIFLHANAMTVRTAF